MQCARALLNIHVLKHWRFVTDATAKIKKHVSFADLNDLILQILCDSPILSADEWFNYHQTLLWNFV